MKVSIIIPVYNVAPYVKNCILSVLNQTYRDIEMIIVDDRTEDDSMSIIDEVLKSSPKQIETKIVHHAQNRGLSAARNTGIDNSNGDYLYFLDSDDEITPTCIELLINSALHYHPDIIVGDYEVRNSELPFPALTLETSFIREQKSILKSFVEKQVYQMAWNKLIRKDFLIQQQLFFKEGLIHEDCLWSFMCACKAQSMAIVHEKTYIYNVRSNSIMTSISLERDFKAYLTVLSSIIQLIIDYKLLNNRLVFSYLEDEKFYLNYAYCLKGNIPEDLMNEYFSLIYTQPFSLIKIFVWGVFHKKYRFRDAHYFLPKDMQRIYYLQLPNYRWRTSDRKLMKRFRSWFLKVLIHKVCGRKWFEYNMFEV